MSEGCSKTALCRCWLCLESRIDALRAERDQLLAEKAQANFSASHPDAMKKMYRINQRLREALENILTEEIVGREGRSEMLKLKLLVEALREHARTALDFQG